MENFKIIQEIENNLFKRREIQISIHSKITPKREEIENSVSEKFSVPKENIKIKKIAGRFGSNDFNIEANIYKSKEDKDGAESKPKKRKEVENKPSEEAQAK